MLLYDRQRQDMHAGGLRVRLLRRRCSTAIFSPELKQGRVEPGDPLAPTGALLSPTSSFQGESIPGICHLVCISAQSGRGLEHGAIGTHFCAAGVLCAVGQILIDRTQLTPARILTGYVVAGVLLSAVGLYEPLADWGGAGATVPLTGFGHALAKGVAKRRWRRRAGWECSPGG